jgi:hypothetical protein
MKYYNHDKQYLSIASLLHQQFPVKEISAFKIQHSICMNKKWLICFIWQEDGVHGVEIVDYH